MWSEQIRRLAVCATVMAVIHMSLLVRHDHALWGVVAVVVAAVAWAVRITIQIERRRAARAEALDVAEALAAEVTQLRR